MLLRLASMRLAARCPMSSTLSPAAGATRVFDSRQSRAQGNWEGEAGRRREAALEWLKTKVAGSGEIEIQWNYVPGGAWASTGGSLASIGVGPLSDVDTYIHEASHVLESRVAGVYKGRPRSFWSTARRTMTITL
jgi:hypothetical protein